MMDRGVPIPPQRRRGHGAPVLQDDSRDGADAYSRQPPLPRASSAPQSSLGVSFKSLFSSNSSASGNSHSRSERSSSIKQRLASKFDSALNQAKQFAAPLIARTRSNHAFFFSATSVDLLQPVPAFRNVHVDVHDDGDLKIADDDQVAVEAVAPPPPPPAGDLVPAAPPPMPRQRSHSAEDADLVFSLVGDLRSSPTPPAAKVAAVTQTPSPRRFSFNTGLILYVLLSVVLSLFLSGIVNVHVSVSVVLDFPASYNESVSDPSTASSPETTGTSTPLPDEAALLPIYVKTSDRIRTQRLKAEDSISTVVKDVRHSVQASTGNLRRVLDSQFERQWAGVYRLAWRKAMCWRPPRPFLRDDECNAHDVLDHALEVTSETMLLALPATVLDSHEPGVRTTPISNAFHPVPALYEPSPPHLERQLPALLANALARLKSATNATLSLMRAALQRNKNTKPQKEPEPPLTLSPAGLLPALPKTPDQLAQEWHDLGLDRATSFDLTSHIRILEANACRATQRAASRARGYFPLLLPNSSCRPKRGFTLGRLWLPVSRAKVHRAGANFLRFYNATTKAADGLITSGLWYLAAISLLLTFSGKPQATEDPSAHPKTPIKQGQSIVVAASHRTKEAPTVTRRA